MKTIKINPLYQNNKQWAFANKNKGRNATFSAIGSTAISFIKTFTQQGSFINKIFNFGQKSLNSIRNYEQYSIYGRHDDDVSFDRINRPLAGIIGKLACIQETKINPILLPLSSFFNENISEAFDSIINFLSSFWWRFRLVFQKISWKKLKYIPTWVMQLLSKNHEKRKQGLKLLHEHLSPIWGILGSFFIGIFVPIKAFNKLKGNENKWIDVLADSGMLTQHSNYLTRFTLDELFKATDTKNKNSWYLFGSGLASNISNVLLPFVDILPLNTTTKTFWRELSQGLMRIFFSSRRYIKGKEWLKVNAGALK